jgi:uncharacterized protein
MTLILDAGPLIALADTEDRMIDPVRQAIAAEAGPLVIPAQVTAEVDYLMGARHGDFARRRFLADLGSGRFDVACLERDEYATAAALDARYADLRLGLSDCAIVVLAARFKTNRLLSFDERHFRAVTPLQGGAFELLPKDG